MYSRGLCQSSYHCWLHTRIWQSRRVTRYALRDVCTNWCLAIERVPSSLGVQLARGGYVVYLHSELGTNQLDCDDLVFVYVSTDQTRIKFPDPTESLTRLISCHLHCTMVGHRVGSHHSNVGCCWWASIDLSYLRNIYICCIRTKCHLLGTRHTDCGHLVTVSFWVHLRVIVYIVLIFVTNPTAERFLSQQLTVMRSSLLVGISQET